MILSVVLALAGCQSADPTRAGSPFAPGVAPGTGEDGLRVAHRLIEAGENELALKALNRAAVQQGLTPEILSAMGTANLGLQRLGQAERLMRNVVDLAPKYAPAWNNLGVILIERGKTAEAIEVFRRAFALDSGRNDVIRQNLTLALANSPKPAYAAPQERQDYRLVRRGTGDYLIQGAP